jgi:peptidylprolyl isomerase
MANKKTKLESKSKPRYAKKVQKKDKSNTIVWIALAALILIIIVVAISLSNKQGQPLSSATTVPTSAPGAAAAPTSSGTKKWSSAPAMQIDKSKSYSASVKMAKGGEFVIQLYADKAPITVNSFVFLARQGYFDGVTFHRVLEGFMAQGGDPTGTGGGGPGYQFVNESSDLKFDKAGVVAMANAGPNTNGSQFFITFGPTPNLNGGYTIFGQVTSGMDVVNAITRRDPDKAPTFKGDAISTITITEK